MTQNSPPETKTGKKKRKKTKTKRPAVCQECGRIWEKDRNGKSELLITCPECQIKKKIFSRLRIL